METGKDGREGKNQLRIIREDLKKKEEVLV
jgi:hypothetical protein